MEYIPGYVPANKLSLNVKKTNYVLFHPPQKKIAHPITLSINGKIIKEVKSIKYLGVLMDSHLNWKDHIFHVTKKISKSIGILSKLRHYVSTNTLVQMYYAFVYPFLTYSCIVWGSTYKTNIKPLEMLQKKAIRIITFSKYDAHTYPLFSKLKVLKIHDIITYCTGLFVYQYSAGYLPRKFDSFFQSVNTMHDYNTRLASKSTMSLPNVRTNYGKFNIRFFGSKVWNTIDESIKSLSYSRFKRELKNNLLDSYK